ncbi:MAG: hypothetical protein HRF45_12470 [Fimbriimonadia bacterium]
MTPIDQVFVAALIVGSGVLTIAALVGALGHAILDVTGGGHHGDAGADVGPDMGAADAGSMHADAGTHTGDAGGTDTSDTGYSHWNGGISQFGLAGVALSYLSPVALAMSFAYFGLFGLGLRAIGVFPVLAVILAIPAGFALSRGTAKLVGKCLAAGSHSSHELVSRLVGRIADVTTAIPERGFGQVTVYAAGSRMQYPARAETALRTGARVMIERIEDGVAFVTLFDESSEPSLLDD